MKERSRRSKWYLFHCRWHFLFPKVLKFAHVRRDTDSKDVLWKLYEDSGSIAYKTVILSRLLLLRMPYFEAEIAKSEQYPHEVAWEDFGSEMFDLLAACTRMLSHIITTSEVMGEFLGEEDYKKELRRLQELKEEYLSRKSTKDEGTK